MTKIKARKLTFKWAIGCIVLSIAMLWLVPFISMLLSSFKADYETNSISMNESFWKLPIRWRTENYSQAINKINFSTTFLNSLIITICSNIVIILFSSMAAWQLLRMKKWYSKVIFYSLLVTMIIPFQAIMIPLIQNSRKMHLINIPGLILVYGGFGMAQSTFMMHGFLKAVPSSLEEVAKIEGYGPIRVYFRIILPLLKPIIITVILLNTMWIWNDFLLPRLWNLENSSVSTMPVMLNVRFSGSFNTRLNLMMAGITIMIIPAIVFFILLQKRIIGGVTRGSIK